MAIPAAVRTPLTSQSSMMSTPSAAPAMQESSHDREASRLLGSQFRREAIHRFGIQQLRIDTRESHGIPTSREPLHLAVGRDQVDGAARTIHDVVVEIV
jgi:hypothetical protein